MMARLVASVILLAIALIIAFGTAFPHGLYEVVPYANRPIGIYPVTMIISQRPPISSRTRFFGVARGH